jgi:hypothetical protein
LPVRVLSRLFRRLYLEGLGKAFEDGELQLHGRLESLRDRKRWADIIARLRSKEWVVYSKPPFGGPLQVLKYLARYTHRVAISNARLLATEQGRVRFLWKDRAAGGGTRTMSLDGVEFVRRFLMHVLPKGFVRIRHYGFLANRARKRKLPLARSLISAQLAPSTSPQDPTPPAADAQPLLAEPERCPLCERGNMRPVGAVPPNQKFPPPDTS